MNLIMLHMDTIDVIWYPMLYDYIQTHILQMTSHITHNKTNNGSLKQYYNALIPKAKHIIVSDITQLTNSKEKRMIYSIDASWSTPSITNQPNQFNAY